MGGGVIIGLLMMTSRAMHEGLWISPEAWESAGAWPDVSLGLEVLAFFGGTRYTDGFGAEKLVVSMSNTDAEEG